jgi:hypothetical protein
MSHPGTAISGLYDHEQEERDRSAVAARAAPTRRVTVTGHPDAYTVRRRPAPTLDERHVGSRPERIAAWAFAMGLLLILIAFLTAHA